VLFFSRFKDICSDHHLKKYLTQSGFLAKISAALKLDDNVILAIIAFATRRWDMTQDLVQVILLLKKVNRNRTPVF
jgi:hypothetical protein